MDAGSGGARVVSSVNSAYIGNIEGVQYYCSIKSQHYTTIV